VPASINNSETLDSDDLMQQQHLKTLTAPDPENRRKEAPSTLDKDL
jgi:hypothetical protein